MKGNEALQKSYYKQKEQFEAARSNRIQNRNVQIKQIQGKINSLTALQQKLELQNSEEKEFETFESFRSKAEIQFREQKKQKEQS